MSSKSNLVLLSLLILLRGRIISGPRDLFRTLRRVGLNKELSTSELSHALEQLYVEEPDGTKQLLVPFRDSISKVCLNHHLTFATHQCHGCPTRSLYVLLRTISSCCTGPIFLSFLLLRRASPMSIALSSVNSWLFFVSRSHHTVHLRSASSLSTARFLSCAPSLVSGSPS
jgi:hypothetical protein